MVYFWFHLNKIIHACIIEKNTKIEKKKTLENGLSSHPLCASIFDREPLFRVCFE